LKPSTDIVICESSIKSGFEAWQKLEFGDVADPAVHQVLGLAAITNLQRCKTAYIKQLQQMRQVRRYVESNNFVLLAALLESERVMALVAVSNKQPVPANSAPLRMLIKMLRPLQAEPMCCPAVLRDCNSSVMRYSLLLVLGREVVLAMEDDKGWDRPPCCVDTLGYCCLLLNALLSALWPYLTL
jgi:hypothetical protein